MPRKPKKKSTDSICLNESAVDSPSTQRDQFIRDLLAFDEAFRSSHFFHRLSPEQRAIYTELKDCTMNNTSVSDDDELSMRVVQRLKISQILTVREKYRARRKLNCSTLRSYKGKVRRALSDFASDPSIACQKFVLPKRSRRLAYARLFGSEAGSAMPEERKDLVDKFRSWNRNLMAHLSHRYRPELYAPRKSVESHIQTFLSSDKLIFLFTGDAGTGKSNLCCHLSQNLETLHLLISLERYHTLRIVSFEMVVDEIIRTASMGSITDLDSLTSVMKSIPTQLVFIIDSLDSLQNPSYFLEGLLRFIELRCSPESMLKFIISCRTETMRLILGEGIAHQDPSIHDLPTSYCYFLTTSSSYRAQLEPLSRFVNVSIFTPEELNEALTLAESFVPMISNVPTRVKCLCEHPYLLRIILELLSLPQADTTNLDAVVDDISILTTFWARAIGHDINEKSKLVLNIVAVLERISLLATIALHNGAESKDVIENPYPVFISQFEESDFKLHAQWYDPQIASALVDKGIFHKSYSTKGYVLSFAHDLLHEYAYAKLMLYLSHEDVIETMKCGMLLSHPHIMKYYANMVDEGHRHKLYQEIISMDVSNDTGLSNPVLRASMFYLYRLTNKPSDNETSTLLEFIETDPVGKVDYLSSMAVHIPERVFMLADSMTSRNAFGKERKDLYETLCIKSILGALDVCTRSQKHILSTIKQWLKSRYRLKRLVASQFLIHLASESESHLLDKVFDIIPDRHEDLIEVKAQHLTALFDVDPRKARLLLSRYARSEKPDVRYYLVNCIVTLSKDQPELYRKLKRSKATNIQHLITLAADKIKEKAGNLK